MTPPLVVCERTGRWAAALRQAFARCDVRPAPRIVETRSRVELERRLVEMRHAGGPSPLPIVELTAAEADAVCELLARLVRTGDEAPTTVVTTDGAAYEAVARTAGANLFVASPRDLEQVVAAYVAYAADGPNRRHAAADDDRTPSERVWAALPWPTS